MAQPVRSMRSRTEGSIPRGEGFGWRNTFGSGKGADTLTSGWRSLDPTSRRKWDNGVPGQLFKFKWELYASPAVRISGPRRIPRAQGTVPMLTTIEATPSDDAHD